MKGSAFGSVRGIIDPELVKPILPYLPPTPILGSDPRFHGTVPRAAALPVHDLLAQFSQESLSFYQKHQQVLERIYDDIADEEDRLLLTSDELCQRIIGQSEDTLSAAERFAIFTLANQQIGLKPLNDERDPRTIYAFRPLRSVRRLRKVILWARLYQEGAATASTKDVAHDRRVPLYSFIDKARRLVLKSRSMRKPTTMSTLGPTIGPVETDIVEEIGESFDKNDQMILEFLVTTYGEVPFERNMTLTSVAALIVRAIGVYPKMEIDYNAGYMLLQELGLLSPWQNIRLSSWALRVPGTGSDLETDRLHNKCQEEKYQQRVDNLPDRMLDLRKDWGDLPVFCVDSKTTTEIDDGFSIEHVPGSPDLKWVHVHVSDELVAQYARRVLSTTYTAEHHMKMLPVRATTERFSLGPNRAAMTISTLCSMDGSIKECQITPSIIRNAIRLTPQQLEDEFSGHKEEEVLLQVGKRSSPTPISEDATWKDHLEDFNALIDVLSAQLQRKRNHPDYLPSWRALKGESTLSVAVENANFRQLDLSCSRHLRGDPMIQIKLIKSPLRNGSWGSSARDVVAENLTAEIMQLACETAALWCKQRNIVIVYSATKENSAWPVRRLQAYLRSDITEQLYDGADWPTRAFTTTPQFHQSIGVEKYSRVTSPLRRYNDQMSHCQINAYLRHQATLDSTSTPSQLQDVLPFTKPQVDRYLKENVSREFRLHNLSRIDKFHWKMQAIFRAFYFEEGGLPDTFLVEVYTTSRTSLDRIPRNVEGILSLFGVRCIFQPSEQGWEDTAEIGDVMRAKIVSINPNFWGELCVEAVGPPIRDALSDQESN